MEEHMENLIEQFYAEWAQVSPEERAYIIIRDFFDLVKEKSENGESIPTDLDVQFWEWFEQPYNRHAKTLAMERLAKETYEVLQFYLRSS